MIQWWKSSEDYFRVLELMQGRRLGMVRALSSVNGPWFERNFPLSEIFLGGLVMGSLGEGRVISSICQGSFVQQ